MGRSVGEPSLIVLTNLIARLGTSGIFDLLELLRSGKTLEEISRAFPGPGFDVPTLSRKIPRIFYRDWFLHEECEEYIRRLQSIEREKLDDERERLRHIAGRLGPKT